MASPPTRGRGLKRPGPRHLSPRSQVAPYAGAWIETYCLRCPPLLALVAPYAGAWIETGLGQRHAAAHRRRPLRGGVD